MENEAAELSGVGVVLAVIARSKPQFWGLLGMAHIGRQIN